jgi:adenine phosphoribosyltransferase
MEKIDLKSTVRSVRDFPKKGIVFRDVTTLFQNPDAFEQLMHEMVQSLQGLDVDLVLGPEARGFTVASVLAYALHAGFVPVRKPGKLPAETISYSYDLEYGSDTLEIHRDAIQPGMRVAVADDLLATGGTALAACRLAEQLGGKVVAVRFAIELTGMGGRETLKDYDVDSVMTFPGD